MATPEELLALVRIRDLEKGGGYRGTPLREFKGTLESYSANLVDRFTPVRTEIVFNFTDIEIGEGMAPPIEPYPFPIAQVSIFYNVNEVSYWGIFANSLVALIPENEGLDYLESKKLHMKVTGGHMMWDGQKGIETPRECWELISVEGAVAPPGSGKPTGKKGVDANPTDVALKLLDGKNIQDWNQIVFQDPAVKSDGDLITSILNNTFIPSMKEKGIVTVDENGVHHVKKGD